MALVSFRSANRDAGPRLHRDGFTLTLYLPFLAWGWFLYAYSPSVPLLAADQRISDAQAGLHGTAMALGGVAAAFLTPRAVLRWGRRGTIVVMSLALSAAVVAFLLGPSLPWTLGALLLVAVSGNMAFAATQVGLALHHGPAASAVIVEGNGLGAAVGLFAPLTVGLTMGLGWGWRPAVLLSPVLFVVAAVLIRRLPLSEHLTGRTWSAPAEPVAGGAPVVDAAPDPSRERWRPGPAAVLFLAGIVAAGGMETAMAYWAPALLTERTGAGPGVATAAMSGLLVGMSAMRFVVGPLSLRVDPAHLLAWTFALSIGGWAIVWTARTPGVAVAGLVLAGLGMGAQYPLSTALLLAATPGRSDRAQGLATLWGALAVGVAPFLLGALSDAFGIHAAFGVIPVFAVAGALAAATGGRAMRRTAEPVAQPEPVAG